MDTNVGEAKKIRKWSECSCGETGQFYAGVDDYTQKIKHMPCRAFLLLVMYLPLVAAIENSDTFCLSDDEISANTNMSVKDVARSVKWLKKHCGKYIHIKPRYDGKAGHKYTIVNWPGRVSDDHETIGY